MTSLRFRYQTIEFSDGLDIHVRTLRDNMQFYDPDDIALELGISNSSWPLFGIVWETGRYLAELMLDFDIRGKRILEVGCGTGAMGEAFKNRSPNCEYIGIEQFSEAADIAKSRECISLLS